MATYYPSITDDQAALIRNAPLFFLASADPALDPGPEGIGPVNLSPKGGVPLHIIDPNRVAFLDYLGSGNETARHADGRRPGHCHGLFFCRRWTPASSASTAKPRSPHSKNRPAPHCCCKRSPNTCAPNAK